SDECVLEDYFEVHCRNRERTSSAEWPCPGVASAAAIVLSNAARSWGSSSMHSWAIPPSFFTNAVHDRNASRRSSSEVNSSSAASICARLMMEKTYTSFLKTES